MFDQWGQQVRVRSEDEKRRRREVLDLLNQTLALHDVQAEGKCLDWLPMLPSLYRAFFRISEAWAGRSRDGLLAALVTMAAVCLKFAEVADRWDMPEDEPDYEFDPFTEEDASSRLA